MYIQIQDTSHAKLMQLGYGRVVNRRDIHVNIYNHRGANYKDQKGFAPSTDRQLKKRLL